MGISPDRQKAVESAMTQIERQFGKGSIMKLGDSPVASVGPLGFIQCSCFRQGASLTAVIDPEPIPIYEEGAHNL